MRTQIDCFATNESEKTNNETSNLYTVENEKILWFIWILRKNWTYWIWIRNYSMLISWCSLESKEPNILLSIWIIKFKFNKISVHLKHSNQSDIFSSNKMQKKRNYSKAQTKFDSFIPMSQFSCRSKTFLSNQGFYTEIIY